MRLSITPSWSRTACVLAIQVLLSLALSVSHLVAIEVQCDAHQSGEHAVTFFLHLPADHGAGTVSIVEADEVVAQIPWDATYGDSSVTLTQVAGGTHVYQAIFESSDDAGMSPEVAVTLVSDYWVFWIARDGVNGADLPLGVMCHAVWWMSVDVSRTLIAASFCIPAHDGEEERWIAGDITEQGHGAEFSMRRAFGAWNLSPADLQAQMPDDHGTGYRVVLAYLDGTVETRYGPGFQWSSFPEFVNPSGLSHGAVAQLDEGRCLTVTWDGAVDYLALMPANGASADRFYFEYNTGGEPDPRGPGMHSYNITIPKE
jgi:hypothetical protein